MTSFINVIEKNHESHISHYVNKIVHINKAPYNQEHFLQVYITNFIKINILQHFHKIRSRLVNVIFINNLKMPFWLVDLFLKNFQVLNIFRMQCISNIVRYFVLILKNSKIKLLWIFQVVQYGNSQEEF